MKWNITTYLLCSLFCLVCFCGEVWGQTRMDQKEKILAVTNAANLKKIAEQAQKDYDALIKLAKEKEWVISQKNKNGSIIHLAGVDNSGAPIYNISNNENAATLTTTNQLWNNGGLDLNLQGNNMLVGVWDGGEVRLTHQEFGGRVTQSDNADALSDHATHVTGTIAAVGVNTGARGMASQATVAAYDNANDVAEMGNPTDPFLVSNHSYGHITGWDTDFDANNDGTSDITWWGDPNIDMVEDWKFGFYDQTAQRWDDIAFEDPMYLICKSAGNDRNDAQPNGTSHFVRNDGVWMQSTANRNPDGTLNNGYDCISTYGNAKNILTIGAVDGNGAVANFSGWGPTDDGRIKPDIMGMGVNVTSCGSTADNSYVTFSGTSMASPNVAGSLILLQEHFENMNGAGNFMRSATLKALAIHTAQDLGNPGPDYQSGWGLLQAADAAQLITDNGTSSMIVEAILTNGGTYTLPLCAGNGNLKVTLCWTDPAGILVEQQLDPTNLMLVNDLDMRITENATSTVSLPYILEPELPLNNATTGDNFRDNVEQINVLNSNGNYTLIITHKGTLQNGVQNFSLIISETSLLNCSSCATESFQDIKENDWFSDYVCTGRSYGLLQDWITTSGTQILFEPSEKVSRKEAAKEIAIAGELKGMWSIDLGHTSADLSQFTDINSNHNDYAPYIKVLYDEGVMTGNPDGTFAPDINLNRAEVAKLLIKGFVDESVDESGCDTTQQNNFTDIIDTEWYCRYVSKAQEVGIFDGYSDGTFGGGHQINRAEFAKVIVNAYEYGNQHTIGHEYELIDATYGVSPNTNLGGNSFSLNDNASLLLGYDSGMDTEGNPYYFHWQSTASITSDTSNHQRIVFTPPAVTQPTDFTVYSWVGADNGKILENHITVTVCPSGSTSCYTPPTIPTIQLSSPEINFGNVYVNRYPLAARSVSITNTTDEGIAVYAQLEDYTPENGFMLYNEFGNNIFYLAPGEYTTFTVRILPTSNGAKSGELRIQYGIGNLDYEDVVPIAANAIEYVPPTLNPPSNYMATGGNLSAFELTFTGDENANQYLLELDSDPSFGGPESILFYSTATAPSKLLYPPDGSGTYYIRGKSLNANIAGGLESAWSATFSHQWVNQVPPVVFDADLLPADGSTNINPASVTLSATITGGEPPFLSTIYFGTHNPEGQPPLVQDLSNTSYTIPYALEANTTYYWSFCVTDANGNENCSNIVEFDTAPDSSAPNCSGFQIAGGASTTNSYTVSLSINSPDTDLSTMEFSNDGTNWSPAYPYSSTYGPWSLAEYGGSPTTGSKTVYVRLTDVSGNQTVCQDQITVQSGAPGHFIVCDKTFASLRAANEYAEAGDDILVTPGYYDLTSEGDDSPYNPTGGDVGFALKDGVNLIGAGAEQTTLYWDDVAKGIVIKNDNLVKGLTLIRPYTGNTRRTVYIAGSNSTLEDCIIADGQTPIEMYHNGSYSNITIQRCVIKNNQRPPDLNDLTNLYFYNNVVAYNQWASLTIGFDLQNGYIKNNVFYENASGTNVNGTNIVYHNNNLYGSSVGDHVAGVNGNITANPNFINPAAGNFHIQSSSPCRNSGTNVGIPYAETSPDMGVFEYNPANGSINMTSNVVGAGFVLVKPDGSSIPGSFNQNINGLVSGIYQAYPQNHVGYYPPCPQFVCLQAGENINLTFTYLLDEVGPEGGIIVNGGRAYTQNPYLTVVNDIEDPINGLENGEMQYSFDGAVWSSPETIAGKKRLLYMGGHGGDLTEGMKTVYAKFTDNMGFEATLLDSIYYKPNGKLTVLPPGDEEGFYTASQAQLPGDIMLALNGVHNVVVYNVNVLQGVQLQGQTNTVFNLQRGFYIHDGASLDNIQFLGNDYGITIYDNIQPSIISNCMLDSVRYVYASGELVNIHNCLFKNISSWSEKFIQAPFHSGLKISNCVFDGSSSLSNLQRLAINMGDLSGEATSTIKNSIFMGFDDDSHLAGAIVFDDAGYTPWEDVYIGYNNFYNCLNDLQIQGNAPVNYNPSYVNPQFQAGTYLLVGASSLHNAGQPTLGNLNFDGTVNTIGMEGGPHYNTPPIAIADVTPLMGGLSTNFVFDASQSLDLETPIEHCTFRWDFDDDGNWDTEYLPHPSITHQFSSYSADSIVCYVFDEHGALDFVKLLNPINPASPDAPILTFPLDGSVLAAIPDSYQWLAVPDAENYDVQVATDPAFGNLIINEVETTEVTLPFSLVNDGNIYYWRVRANNVFGSSEWSEVWSYSHAFQISYTANEPTCPGNNDGAIDLQLTGGVAPYDISWSNGATTLNLTALMAGTYSVTVGDASGASETTAIMLDNPVVGFVSLEDLPLVQFSAFPEGLSSYTWSFGDGATGSGKNTTHIFENSGLYDVCLTVGDGVACSETHCETIEVSSCLAVTNTNDSGSGSLRAAMECALPGDIVTFNIPGAGPHVISPQTALPTIFADSITIDASTQPAYQKGIIEIDGTAVNNQGLEVQGSHCTIKGLYIHSFNKSGIHVNGNDGTADYTIIDDCVISGNGQRGAVLYYSDNTQITNCFLGTNVAGTAANPNATYGAWVTNSANLLVENNVISGNATSGLFMQHGSDNAVIRNNNMGTNAAGTAMVGNGGSGVHIYNCSGPIVENCLVSGNGEHGVKFSNCPNGIVRGGKIGTDIAGMLNFGNAKRGITISGTLSNNIVVGGVESGHGNLISGSGEEGLYIHLGSYNVRVFGNKIGTNMDGTATLGNGGSGIYMDGVHDITIGGANLNEENLISGNLDGIVAENACVNIDVSGNKIGTDISGSFGLGNQERGIHFMGVDSSTITTCLISGNGMHGLSLDSTSTNIRVQGNKIGTDITGNSAIGNAQRGINIVNSSNNITIGGSGSEEGNLISGNGGNAIVLLANAHQVYIYGNKMGTAIDGTTALGNEARGIYMNNVSDITIGGIMSGEGNVISANAWSGIAAENGCIGIYIFGNKIGTDVTGTLPLGNGHRGVHMSNVSNSVLYLNIVGDSSFGNAGGQYSGIVLTGGSTNVGVMRNRIGLGWYGENLGNGGAGIHINNASDIAINQYNKIAYNLDNGIKLSNGAFDVDIGSNAIYCNDGLGISNVAGTNNDMPPPMITQATPAQILGTSQAGANIMVFAHDAELCLGTTCQGKDYLGGTVADANGNWSVSGSFGTGEATATATLNGNTSEFADCVEYGYCDSYSNNSALLFIQNVFSGNISNTSGDDGGYADYTAIGTDLEDGDKVYVTFNTAFSNPALYCYIWIDLNGSGTFEEPDELVAASQTPNGAVFVMDLSIPSGAIGEAARMRISLKYDDASGIPNPCGTFDIGEVEDYAINIINACPENVTINHTANLSDFISAVNNVTIDGDVTVALGETKTVTAGESISVEPGFVVEEGASFTAGIAACSPPASKRLPKELVTLPNLKATPNPFAEQTTLSYWLGETQNVNLAVYDTGGRQLASLISGMQEMGGYQVNCNMNDLPSGIYLCILKTPEKTEHIKLVKGK